MFLTSTQRRNWIFHDELELARLREEANKKFTEKWGADILEEEHDKHFLTAQEERLLLIHYEHQLQDFCIKFQPPMPQYVIGTTFHYFKRFYLFNSVMDFHPKEILVTCVYLASKVEEFNISITQFVANVRGDREKASDVILNNELLLMQQLHYNLLVHNILRPIEGLLIDIKARCISVSDPEQLRPGIEEFLLKINLTDVCLLFAPSQIALAAVLQSASKIKKNMDAYVTDTLLGSDKDTKLKTLIETVRKIRTMVMNVDTVSRDVVKQLEKKLDKCRNQEYNPESQIYRHKMRELMSDEEEKEEPSHARLAANRKSTEDRILSTTLIKDSPKS